MKELKIESFQIKRILWSDDVMNVCIREELYTRGDTKAYESLLQMFEDGVATDAKITRAAEDIYKHSDIKKLMSVYGVDENEIMKMILSNLLNASFTYIESLEMKER